jgi:hypothetical protein
MFTYSRLLKHITRLLILSIGHSALLYQVAILHAGNAYANEMVTGWNSTLSDDTQQTVMALFYDGFQNINSTLCRFGLNDSNDTTTWITGFELNDTCLGIAAINGEHNRLTRLNFDDPSLRTSLNTTSPSKEGGNLTRVIEDVDVIRGLIERTDFQNLMISGYWLYLLNSTTDEGYERVYGSDYDSGWGVRPVAFSSVETRLFPAAENEDLPEPTGVNRLDTTDDFRDNSVVCSSFIHCEQNVTRCEGRHNAPFCPSGTQRIGSNINPASFECEPCGSSLYRFSLRTSESMHEEVPCQPVKSCTETESITAYQSNTQYDTVCDCEKNSTRFVLIRPAEITKKIVIPEGQCSECNQLCPNATLASLSGPHYKVNYNNNPPSEPSYEFRCFAPLVPVLCAGNAGQTEIGMTLQYRENSTDCFYPTDNNNGQYKLARGNIVQGSMILSTQDECSPNPSPPITSTVFPAAITTHSSGTAVTALVSPTPSVTINTSVKDSLSAPPWHIVAPAVAGGVCALVAASAGILFAVTLFIKLRKPLPQSVDLNTVRNIAYSITAKSFEMATGQFTGSDTYTSEALNPTYSSISGEELPKEPVYETIR